MHMGGRILTTFVAAGVLAGLCAMPSSLPPAASATGPTLGGCPMFPANNPWNTKITSNKVLANSATYIRNITSPNHTNLHADFGGGGAYGIPFKVVPKTQVKVPIHYTAYGDESDPGPFRFPLGAPVEGGARSDGDRHVLAIDRSTCTLFELYRAFPKRGPHPHWNADSGARWNLLSTARRPDSWTSADAAGLPIFPGLVRYDEVAAGHVDHAIRVTFDNTRDAWVHPASHCAGETTDPRAPAMGTRLRLRASYGLGHFTGAARTIAEALKQYGLIVADNGSNWYFGGTSDRRWDDENLDQLKRIPGSAFQVVKSAARPHAC